MKPMTFLTENGYDKNLSNGPTISNVRVDNYLHKWLPACKNFIYKTKDQIRRYQWKQITKLVTEAYENVPFYREIYSSVGFTPKELRTWNDFFSLPIVTKEQLIKAGKYALNRKFNENSLFWTVSSGTTGKILRMAVDKKAIIIDTVQGIRQLWLQSNKRYTRDHLSVDIYTRPWWITSISGKYRRFFISPSLATEKIAEMVKEVRPHILSYYPDDLKSILEISTQLSDRLYLVTVNSELSTKKQRSIFSEMLGGIPVLDEYSSEELTRIALELPCQHYHICEDAVFLEILKENTLHPIETGMTGITIGTNLLNEAMPFIRYNQGDYVSIPKKSKPCQIHWGQIEKINGRMNDSFLRKDNKMVPVDRLIDVIYQLIYETGALIEKFEIIQKSLDRVDVSLFTNKIIKKEIRLKFHKTISQLLCILLGSNIHVKTNILKMTNPTVVRKKYRPIRREFD